MIFQSSDSACAGIETTDFDRIKSPLTDRRRIVLALGLVLTLTGVCGCHKKTAAEPPPQSAPVTADATTAKPTAPLASYRPPPQALPAVSPAVPADATAEVATGQLSRELRRYVAYTRTIPKSFEDFTAHDPIKFPPPPAGKKYFIDGADVVLK